MGFDEKQLHHVIEYCYDRAVALYRYSPDVWLEYASYQSAHNWDDAVQVLKRGMDSLSTSIFYQLGCCDFYEKHGHLEEATRQYEGMVSSTESALAWIQYIYFIRRTRGIDEARQIFRRARLSVLQPELFIAAGTNGVSSLNSSPRV